MINRNSLIQLLISLMVLFIVFSIAGQAQAQWLYPFNPYLGFNPYFFSYPTLPYAFSPPVFMPYPFFGAPVLTPPLPSRVGAATIIVTNPTAGTVSIINPTVASVPAATVAAPSPTPLLSLLATIYTSALYEGLLSTANPLLFATLQTLFL
jgi:hypothetical protein